MSGNPDAIPDDIREISGLTAQPAGQYVASASDHAGQHMSKHVRADGQVRGQLTKAGWSVKQWCAETDICRTSTYKLIKADKIRSILFGSRRIILTPPGQFLETLAVE